MKNKLLLIINFLDKFYITIRRLDNKICIENNLK